jgi:hypothetical protein
MHMISGAETRSISIAAPPEAVLNVVGDAPRLAQWAPNFASEVRAEGRHWLVRSGDVELLIDVRVAPEQGTVDIVAAGDPRRGAFTRVVPNGEGSEYLFTLLFGDGTPDEAIAAQMATVEEELRAVRDLAEVAT